MHGAHPPPARSVLFVGNATVVLRWDDITIMTDPNFLHRGQYAYLGKGLLTRRLKEPAFGVADVPALDGIVLSHLHGDHFDRVARRGLDRALPVVTTRQAARRMRGFGFDRSVGLEVWQDWELVSGSTWMKVTAVPGRHGPGPLNLLLPAVMGSIIEFGRVGRNTAQIRLYITGDTLMFEGIKEIPKRHPDIDLALIHLGGTTLPGGVLVTMDGRQGADLFETVGPRAAAPIHFDDYGRFRSPLSDFEGELAKRGLGDRLRILERGAETPIPL